MNSDCQKCDADTSQTAWRNHASGVACGDDGYTCTADTCDGSGACLHAINLGTCLIGSVCYVDGEDHPTDVCNECNSTLTMTTWSNVPNDTVSRACYPCAGGAHGIGICLNGIQWCTNGAFNACAGMQCPEADLCDSFDNDCDGNTDEGYPNKGAICDGGDYDQCRNGTLTCTPDGSDVECVNDGPVALFKFNEGSGATVGSDSGPVADGTLHVPSWTATGKTGTGLVFDGVDDYVDVPHHSVMDATSALTIEAWIHPTSGTGTWRVIGGLYDGGTGGYYLAMNNAQGPGLSANLGAACGWQYSGVKPALNVWSHAAVTYDGASVKFFLNGAEIHTATCDGNGGQLGPAVSPLHIGGLGAANPTQAPFAGALDDFALYTRTLTPAEIKSRSLDGDACDGVDNDCDTLVDESTYKITYQSAHTPTHGAKGDACDGDDSDWCAHSTLSCSADNLFVECVGENPTNIPEACNGLDDDCNTVLPANEHDDDSDGFMICEGDCDDTSLVFHPDMDEICDGFDNNCDNTVLVAEQDLDGDLHLACVPGQIVPGEPGGASADPLDWADCDDTNERIHADFPEVCDNVDNDCDGAIDANDSNHLALSIDAHTPIGVAAGVSGIDITFYGKNFVLGLNPGVIAIDFGYGVNVADITVLSSTEMVANINVDAADTVGIDLQQLYSARDIVIDMGGCQVVIPHGFDVVDPALVPTLTEWGVILLSALVLAFGLVALRRRRLGHLAI